MPRLTWNAHRKLKRAIKIIEKRWKKWEKMDKTWFYFISL